MNRRVTTALAHLTAAAVVAIVGPAAAPTNPAAASVNTPEAATVPGPHCAVLVDTGKMACSATPEAARRALGPKAVYLVAKLWKHADFRGDSLPYYKSSGCTSTFSDKEIQVPVVPSGWNDQLSSAKTDITTPNTRCSLIIFEHGRYGGASRPVENESYLGPFWNDRASSWYIT